MTGFSRGFFASSFFFHFFSLFQLFQAKGKGDCNLTVYFGNSMPVLGQKVQKSTVGNHSNVRIVSQTSRNLPQRQPGISRSRRQLIQRRLKVAPLALEIPALADPAHVDFLAKLGGQLLLWRPRVGGRIGALLQRVQGDHGQQLLSAKGVDAGVQRAAHARGDEALELGVVRELGAQVGALLDAEGGEVWVGELFVFFGEVVVALGVADEVDCWSHVCSAVYDINDE